MITLRFPRLFLPFALGCALAALPLIPVHAQEASSSPAVDTKGGKLKPMEAAFVKKAGEANAAEVKAGNLALQNADSQEVKDFAQMMVKDHTEANDELSVVAKNHDVEFPPAETAAHKEEYEKLSKLKGAAFDKAYIAAMVKGHTKVLSEYKMAKPELKDGKLVEYRDKVEPKVAEHLKMAKELKAKMMK